jgi:3-oxoacyl-[acyl-carrier protein] reductase
VTVERPLKGRTAWVTGSSRGIGRAIAEDLAALGASVAIHGSSEGSPAAFGEVESLEALAGLISESTGSPVMRVVGDLCDEAVVLEAVEAITGAFGPIDILVNCAGGDIGAAGVHGPSAGKPQGNNALDISLDDIRTVLDRNILTCILCCRAVAPAMRDRKSGWIVSIGSVAGMGGRPETALYSTAKAAMHEYTRCLAALLRPHNVRVNVVAPGPIYTARFAASRPIDEKMLVEDGTLERYGKPIEVAKAVSFLVTGGTYITGQVIRVDGGLQMWPG